MERALGVEEQESADQISEAGPVSKKKTEAGQAMIILQPHGLSWTLMHQREKKQDLQRSNPRLLHTGLSPAITA
jgi:hypothetical protein